MKECIFQNKNKIGIGFQIPTSQKLQPQEGQSVELYTSSEKLHNITVSDITVEAS